MFGFIVSVLLFVFLYFMIPDDGVTIKPDDGVTIKPDIGIFESDLDCISEAIYFESRGEPERGQQLVAWSIINRSIVTGLSMCEVVHYPMQYSYRNCINPDTNKPINAKEWNKILNKVCPVLVMSDLQSKANSERIAMEVLDDYNLHGATENTTHFHHIRLGGVRYGGTNSQLIGNQLYYSAPDAL